MNRPLETHRDVSILNPMPPTQEPDGSVTIRAYLGDADRDRPTKTLHGRPDELAAEVASLPQGTSLYLIDGLGTERPVPPSYFG